MMRLWDQPSWRTNKEPTKNQICCATKHIQGCWVIASQQGVTIDIFCCDDQWKIKANQLRMYRPCGCTILKTFCRTGEGPCLTACTVMTRILVARATSWSDQGICLRNANRFVFHQLQLQQCKWRTHVSTKNRAILENSECFVTSTKDHQGSPR